MMMPRRIHVLYFGGGEGVHHDAATTPGRLVARVAGAFLCIGPMRVRRVSGRAEGQRGAMPSDPAITLALAQSGAKR